MLPRHSRTAFSRHRYNGHSLPLSSYLTRIGRIENPSCSACGHPSQGIFHLIIHCPAKNSLRRLPFGDSLPFYRLWSGDALGNCPASGVPWSFAMPSSFRRGWITATRKSINAPFSLRNKFFSARKHQD